MCWGPPNGVTRDLVKWSRSLEHCAFAVAEAHSGEKMTLATRPIHKNAHVCMHLCSHTVVAFGFQLIFFVFFLSIFFLLAVLDSQSNLNFRDEGEGFSWLLPHRQPLPTSYQMCYQWRGVMTLHSHNSPWVTQVHSYAVYSATLGKGVVACVCQCSVLWRISLP